MCGAAVFSALHDGHDGDPPSHSPARLAPSPQLALARTPYMGVSCPRANSIACDRVGLAVWLDEPATHLTATIGRRHIAMRLPCGTGSQPESCDRYCRDRAVQRDQPCGTYFEGFLHPAGLTHGPLRVRLDRGTNRWTGAKAPLGTVHLVARDRNGRTARTDLRVRLSPGWG